MPESKGEDRSQGFSMDLFSKRDCALENSLFFFFFKLISFRVFWFVLVSTCIGVYEVIEVISYVLV